MAGMVDAGSIGELVFRIIACIAHDKLKIEKVNREQNAPKMFSDPVNVKDFINFLVPESYQEYYQNLFGVPCYDEENENVSEMMEMGEISFTTIEIVDSMTNNNLSQEFLKNAFDHRFAFTGSKTLKGSDLIIPVLIPSADEDDDGFVYGYIVIRVKNHDGIKRDHRKRIQAAGEKLSSSYCFPSLKTKPPYIGIYVELGFEEQEIPAMQLLTKPSYKRLFSKYGNHIVLLDLSKIEFIDDNIKTRLSRLRHQTVDYVDKEANIRTLKLSDPHRYYNE